MAGAYVYINLNISVDFPTALQHIRAIHGVQEAHLVVGPTDCIARVQTAEQHHLLEVLQAIRVVEGVERTDTRYIADL